MGKDGEQKGRYAKPNGARLVAAVLFEDQEMIHLGCSSQERPRLRGKIRRCSRMGSVGPVAEGWLLWSRLLGGSGSLETLPSALRQDEQGGE